MGREPGETWRFHHSGIEWTKLDPKTGMETPTHPYYARPWKWILLLRPISFYVKDYGTDTEQILAIGNPVIFWASVVAIPFVALAWRRLRDWRAGFLRSRCSANTCRGSSVAARPSSSTCCR